MIIDILNPQYLEFGRSIFKKDVCNVNTHLNRGVGWNKMFDLNFRHQGGSLTNKIMRFGEN